VAALHLRRGGKWLTRELLSSNPRLPGNRGFFVEHGRLDQAAQKKGQNMNRKYRSVPTQFGPETGFEVRPSPPAPFRAQQEAEFERLKARLLSERLEALGKPQTDGPLSRAANEAAALAWVTRYPLLLFPVLFEEKAITALLRAERQEQVRQRSRELLAA
jgi:hypothetical protein